ncbi:MAG: hypothetical protein KF749_17970 [Bacteroidetes bacterium]|nr:hypothetical protein [Bacteroidota bacterium]MCW5896729.1 hypothetical protein [Bacteroidota bacterium]
MKKQLGAKEYFEKKHFPLFFDHPRYLQSPAGTPLFQLIAQKTTHKAKEREKALVQIASKIDAYLAADDGFPEMSFALGYPSADHFATTSGQVTTMPLGLGEEEMYASWIGAGFGVGIAGGLNILIDSPEVLKAIAEGWSLYRKYVDENKGIDNKVETWNGIWLVHRFDEQFRPKSPAADFHPIVPARGGEAQMERPAWTSVLFALARALPKQTVNAYVYSFGQMNRTIGFVRFALPEVKKLSDFYISLFGKTKTLSNKNLQDIYESQYGLSTACERFSMIGLRSFEPKDLWKFMPGRSNSNAQPKFKSDEKSIINYSIYITWIVAMLNNKALLDLAQKAADTLRQFEQLGKKGTNTRNNQVKELLASRNRKELIDRLTEVVETDRTTAEVCNLLVQTVMTEIAADNVPLFVTLMRFKYAMPN